MRIASSPICNRQVEMSGPLVSTELWIMDPTSKIILKGGDMSPGGKRAHVPALQILRGKAGGLPELSRVEKPPVFTKQRNPPRRERRNFSRSASLRCLSEMFLSHEVAVCFFLCSGGCHPRLSSFEPSARNKSCSELFSVYINNISAA